MKTCKLVPLLCYSITACLSLAAEPAAPDGKWTPPSGTDAIIKEILLIERHYDNPFTQKSVSSTTVDNLLRLIDPKDYLKAASALIPKKPESEYLAVSPYLLTVLWGRVRPEEAYPWLKANAPSQLSDKFGDEMLAAWAQKDVRGALKFAGPETAVLNAIALESPQEAVELSNVRDNPGDTDNLVYYWTKLRPEKAAAWVLAKRHNPWTISMVGRAWSSMDRPSAKRWADSLEKNYAVFAWGGIVSQITDSQKGIVGDPETAAKEFSKRFPTPDAGGIPDPDHFIKRFASEIAFKWNEQGHPEKALEWILKFPEGTARDELATSLFTTWANSDAPALLAVAKKIPPGVTQDMAVSAACESLAMTTRLLMDTPPREPLLETALGIKDVKSRDQVLAKLAGPLARKQPARAFDMSRKIEDPELRTQALAEVLGFWLLFSPKTAVDSLSGLKEEEKQHVLAQLQMRAVLGGSGPH